MWAGDGTQDKSPLVDSFVGYSGEAMSKRAHAIVVFFTVLGTLCKLMWSPNMWKTLYQWKSHLNSASRSGHVPGVYYSQDGEDVSLCELLPEAGFYVDIGAHHPERFSVTKLLYDRGWSGINVDVTPSISREFMLRRSRDTNLESLVGSPGNVVFYRFVEEALNTTNRDRAEILKASGWELVSDYILEIRSLTEVLGQSSSPSHIDFLNVDVEGADFDVLASLDWDHYSVGAVLVEIGRPIWDLENDQVAQFLASKGMRATLCFPRSVLFLEAEHSANSFFRQ